jgi:hypothetical protein
LENIDLKSIELTWTGLEYPENGGDDFTGYTVFWGEGSPSAEWKILAEFKTSVFSVNTIEHGVTLVPYNVYKFKI